MSKWIRRITVFVGALLCIVGISAIIGWRLLRGTPEWYQPSTLSNEQRDAAADRAERKLEQLTSAASFARAAGRNQPVTRPAGAITISFTDDEINALFDKWSVLQSIKAGYERYMTEPRVILKDGRLIIAGRMHEIDAVASLHFEPRIESNGKLSLKLARTLAGNLPLPQAVLAPYQQKAASGIVARLPWWRQQAAIDSTGVANSSAISAVMGALLIDVLGDRPSEPILFLPLFDRGSVPARISEVKIDDRTLTLTVLPMNAAERAQLLESIRSGQPIASGGR